MREKDFEKMFPQIPDCVNQTIEDTVNENIGKKFPEKRRRKYATVAATIAAALIVVPTCAFAASKVYYAYIEQTDKYEYLLNVSTNETKGSTEDDIQNANATAGTIPMQLQLNYVPEDLQYNESGPYEGKYTTKDFSGEKGMTVEFYLVPENGVHEVIRYSSESQTWTTTEGNTAILIDTEKGWDQLWISFCDTPYVAKIFLNGCSQEEIWKIAQESTLIPSDVETAHVWKEQEVVEMEKIKDEPGYFVSVGDNLKWYGKENISVHIDSVSIQNDFAGIDTDCIGAKTDYSKYLNSDGIIQTKRGILKPGNGKNTMDTFVSIEENVTQKVVKMELTVTNTGEETEPDINFCPMPGYLYEGAFEKMDTRIMDGEAYSVFRTETGSLSLGEFSFSTSHSHNKNNIVDLKSGESAVVTICFLIDEDMLEDSYIQLMYGYKTTREQPFLALGEILK